MFESSVLQTFGADACLGLLSYICTLCSVQLKVRKQVGLMIAVSSLANCRTLLLDTMLLIDAHHAS